MQPEIIVALDVPTATHISGLIQRLPAQLRCYKVGLELFTAEGPSALIPLKKAGKQIFLDLKLHDIPRTAARAVTAAAQHGVRLLTVHASGGKAMLKDVALAARDAGPAAPKLLAVTMLTSLDQSDLRDLGVQRAPAEHVLKMADLALSNGVDGLVCSPQEVKHLRATFGPDPILVTPGIRLPSDNAGDQKRTGSPSQAARDGATFLVVGRPIVEAADPSHAAMEILKDLELAGG